MKSFLVRCVLIAVGIALELALVEGALRLLATHPRDAALARARVDLARWFPVMNSGLYRRDDDSRLLFTLAPDLDITADGVRYRTNDLGLRGGPVARPKPAGTKRVLLLGDSYAFGLGVNEEQSIGAALSRALSSGAPSIEVVNLGVPAYHTGQEAALLERLGPVLQPDLVVLLFYDNDAIYHGLRYDEQRRFLHNDELPIPSWVRTVFSESALYGWLSRIYTQNLEDAGLLRSGTTYWPVTRLRLERIEALCRELGVPLVIANLPFIYYTTYMLDPQTFAPHADLYERVAEFARQRSIPWVDLLQRISPQPTNFASAWCLPTPLTTPDPVTWAQAFTRSAWLGAHLFRPVEFLMIAPREEDFDNHFNAWGCRLVGEAIGARIRPLL